MYEHLHEKARARVEALLSIPAEARRALWMWEAPGWGYWYGLASMSDVEGRDEAWYSEGLQDSPVGLVGFEMWEGKPAPEKIDVEACLWCPAVPALYLEVCAQVLGDKANTGAITRCPAEPNSNEDDARVWYARQAWVGGDAFTADFYADPVLAGIALLGEVWTRAHNAEDE